MPYPDVWTEEQTIAFARRRGSLARFGDGELNLCNGRPSVSQEWSPQIEAELRAILAGPTPGLLTCIPNLRPKIPRWAFWAPFGRDYFVRLYGAQCYGSSFITRPDNAPWIDTPTYWESVRSLWRDTSVCYVGGEHTLFDVVHPIKTVMSARRNAYSDLDRVEKEIAAWPGLVVISLGAAGTCLAARLSRKGVWALDLGHIGQFMKNPGAFAFEPEELATPAYRKLLRHAHATTNWGRGGASWADPIAKFVAHVAKLTGEPVSDVLDYGCGGRTLAPALAERGIKCKEYDPGVDGLDIPPKLADIVVSTDVFEHIETELVSNVLAHTFALARKGAFFVIAKQPAKKILADGRNAHLTCRETAWWVDQLKAAGWANIKVVTDEWKKCALQLLK